MKKRMLSTLMLLILMLTTSVYAQEEKQLENEMVKVNKESIEYN